MGVIVKVGNVEKNYFSKLPSEQYTVTVDFSDEVGGGTVDSFAVNVADSSGTSLTTTLIQGVTESSDILSIGVVGGATGEVYTITSSVTTNQQLPDGATNYSFSAKIYMRIT